MEIESLIKKMKDIYSALIDFIEEEEDCEAKFETLIGLIEKHQIYQSKEEIGLLFQLISNIADNHHHTTYFFDKIEKILQSLIKDFPSSISNFIPDYTKYNKRFLFFLLEKNLLKPDETFLKQYLQNKPINYPFSIKNLSIFQSYYYLYPVIKEFLNEEIQKRIEEEIQEYFDINEISIFTKKCQIGENDSYICSLIRSDSVEEFIAYVNRTNLSLLTKIKPSIYETHSFLIDKEPTLIEYAAFFGSIQIIQYLKYNKVPLTSSLWIYEIHSNNAELIHFLEENEVKPEKNENNYFISNSIKESFDGVFIESIKCHHNAISNYIKDNYYDRNRFFFYGFSATVIHSLNFFFVPDEIETLICGPIKIYGFNLSQLCFFLTTVTIPPSVTSIADDAFYKCSSLTQITIPSSVTSIGNRAFSNCSSLTQITIPSSVTSIEDYAFYKCSSLTQILFEIPSFLTSIGNGAFLKCKSLLQITIPSSVTSIGNHAFSKCSKMAQITIPSSVALIRKKTFLGCSSLEKIVIPSSVTEIGDFSFSGCSSLTQVTFTSSVTSIGNSAFYECSSLSQITIPSSVTSIKNNAFSKCSSLTQITILSSITSIGNNSFDGVISLDILGDIEIIYNSMFSNCSSLRRITIPSSVTSIGDDAFAFCLSLTQITIPSSVTSIGNSAFCGCSSLTQITIPSSVTSIGYCAFSFCESLTQITIPSSLRTAEIGLNSKAQILRI